MRWAECGALAAMLLAGLAHADAPGYGKVETFQPGKKYNCVPSADRKGWDCNESGKTAEPRPQPQTSEGGPAASTPAVAPAAESTPKSGALPSYLTNAAASGQSRAQQATPPRPAAEAHVTSPAPEPAAPASAPIPAASQPAVVETPSKPPVAATPPATPEPKPASANEPAATQTAAPPVSTSPPAADASPVAVAIAPSSADAASRIAGNREFLALPPASYIVEIAHGVNRDELAALRANLHLPLVDLYELHLTRDGGDWWLLVWGHFADIESARAARSDLPADAAVNAGWPRRIAPLQAEVRRTSE